MLMYRAREVGGGGGEKVVVSTEIYVLKKNVSATSDRRHFCCRYIWSVTKVQYYSFIKAHF